MPKLASLTAATESQPQFVINSARIRSATLVLIPAFAEAYVELTGEPDEEGLVPWEGILAVEDISTGDGRKLASGSLRWDNLPMPLGWTERNEGGHFGAVSVGRIDSIVREGNLIKATGVIDTSFEGGHAVARLIANKMAGGVSVDLDDIPEDAVEYVGEDLIEVAAALVGDTSLPVLDDRERSWDGPGAASRVLDWATSDGGSVDADRLSRAFLWRDDDANPETLSAYKLGFADVIDGRLYIIPRGVFATAGGRGVDSADIPEADKERVRSRITTLYNRVSDALDDPDIEVPWSRTDSSLTDEELGLDRDPEFEQVTASAWTEFKRIESYPSEWFATPSREELPTDKGGVFARDGRIWGWVAQKNVVHDKYRNKKLTLSDLSPLDTTYFLRSTVPLDNGSSVRVGVITMNSGHHRDGAVCETEQCQFDDTRTVAGIVTVGMSKQGLWFSGAAAPWLSNWDWSVFKACQPSLHVVWEKGVYNLRAVLTVPNPGFPTRLTASAVVDRSNIALLSNPDENVGSESKLQEGILEPFNLDYDELAKALATHLPDRIAEAIDRREEFKAAAEQIRSEFNDTFAEMVEDMKLDVNGGNE